MVTLLLTHPYIQVQLEQILSRDSLSNLSMKINRVFMVCGGLLGILSAILCFFFIYFKLKINHIIKKILFFAVVQQVIGYIVSVTSLILVLNGFINKFNCSLLATSIPTITCGTQMCIASISIIRYYIFTVTFFHLH